ncbi:sugar phosphate nucleotidyltransferase [Luminiphilus sp.]|nr:sugar phosphate nucleotidyltransferase [Luminiphilus sp.]
MARPTLVLAGGFGSRLKSVVSDVPKPLAPVCGKPFLTYLIENLVLLGAREFIFLLHYEADAILSVISEYIDSIGMDDIKITSLVEDRPLGTGGSIMNAVNVLNIKKSFMVVNADTWLGCGFEQLSFSSPNTIAAVEVEDCSRYGALDLASGKIKRFIEKKSSCGPGLINAGLYHLSQDIFQGFSSSANFSLETDLFPSVIHRIGLSALQIETDFIDIGIPEDYFRFCKWIESGRACEL